MKTRNYLTFFSAGQNGFWDNLEDTITCFNKQDCICSSIKIIRRLKVTLFFILFIIFTSFYVQAQDNNVWSIEVSSSNRFAQKEFGHVFLDFNTCPPNLKKYNIDTLKIPSKNSGTPLSIGNELGYLSYYATEGNFLVDSMNIKAASFSISGFDSSSTSIRYTQNWPIKGNQVNVLFRVFPDKPYPVNSRQRDSICLLQIIGSKPNISNIQGFELSRFGGTSRKDDILFSSINDSLCWILEYDTSSLNVLKLDLAAKKIVSRESYFNDISRGLLGDQYTNYTEFDNTLLSPNDSLICIRHFNYDKTKRYLSLCHFDKTDGSLTNKRILDSSNNVYSYMYFEFSPCSKYLYITSWDSPGRRLIRFDLLTNLSETFIIPQGKLILGTKFGPDGKLYFFTSNFNIGVINQPSINDWKSTIQFDLPYLNLHQINGFDGTTTTFSDGFPKTNGIYRKVKFNYGCIGQNYEVSFHNESDSTHFTRYRFYFGDGDSAEIDNENNLLIAGLDNKVSADNWGILHRYAKAGKYLVKLRAFNEAGGWVWYSDSITVVEASVPKFSIQDTLGCQWVGYEIQDLSKVVNKGKDISYHWSFGDGTDSTEINPRTNTKLFKTYTQSGDYAIQLTINDGYCTDSFSLVNKVKILEAPQPGIVANPTEGCEPLVVNVNYKYNDAADSIVYYWGNGKSNTTTDGKAQFTYQLYPDFTTTQYCNLEQELHGPTGCITRDTIQITVHPGFYSTDTPRLNVATVNADQYIALSWDSFPGATGYAVYRNQNALTQTSQFSWVDSVSKAQLQTAMQYTIKAVNVCDEKTAESNIGQNIVLTGTNEKNNKISVVQWTPYEKWQLGVSDYAIEVQQANGSFAEVYRQQASGNLVYQDEAFLATALSQNQTSKCYRIAAYEKDYQQQISHSNLLCLPYTPVLFIPTAITPNADGLNDVFKPITFGIESYNVQIYNRWGQLVADFDETAPGWEAKEMPQGAYMVTIRAKGNDNNWYTENSTVTVVR